jgi:hypothetical protein
MVVALVVAVAVVKAVRLLFTLGVVVSITPSPMLKVTAVLGWGVMVLRVALGTPEITVAPHQR